MAVAKRLQDPYGNLDQVARRLSSIVTRVEVDPSVNDRDLALRFVSLKGSPLDAGFVQKIVDGAKGTWPRGREIQFSIDRDSDGSGISLLLAFHNVRESNQWSSSVGLEVDGQSQGQTGTGSAGSSQITAELGETIHRALATGPLQVIHIYVTISRGPAD
jgi:hypothetical protein